MVEHQRNYPEPAKPTDGGSLWDPAAGARRSGDWPDPPPARHDADGAATRAEQWQLGADDREPPRHDRPEHDRNDPRGQHDPREVVDPELAALAGGEPRGPVPPEDAVRRGPLPPAPADPHGGRHDPHRDPRGPAPVPPPHQAGPPVSGGPAGAPMQVDPPTQAYPSMPRGPERRTEPVGPARRSVQPAKEVAEGVYRKRRPAMGLMVAAVSAVAAVPGLVLLLRSLFGDNPVSGSVAGLLLMVGLPLVGAGLSPLLGSGPRIGGRELTALMRPPYVYLVTGLVLVIAAGLAA